MNDERIDIATKIARKYRFKWMTGKTGTLEEVELVNVAMVAILEKDKTFTPNDRITLTSYRHKVAAIACLNHILNSLMPVHMYVRWDSAKKRQEGLGVGKHAYDTIENPEEDVQSLRFVTAANKDLGRGLIWQAMHAAVQSDLGIFASMNAKNAQTVQSLLADAGDRCSDQQTQRNREYKAMVQRAYQFRTMTGPKRPTLRWASDWL